VKGETIPHREKIFSWFEPHTEWIMKGKLFPPVELGHKLLVTTDQHELILDYQVLEHSAVESDIHCLEHHGLNRCPDKGRRGYGRYVGFGVLAYNLHKIGARLLWKRARA
jgi:hypothetical protein